MLKCLRLWCPDAIKYHPGIHHDPMAGYSNIPGNDLVDRSTKQATELPPLADLPIGFSSALNVIKKVIRDPDVAHDQTRDIYTHYTVRRNVNSKTTFRTSPCITSLLTSIRS